MKRNKAVLKMGAENIFLSLICTAALISLLVSRRAAAEGAAEGLALCGRVVIPALFPFMFLVDFVAETRVSAIFGRAVSPLFERLFGFSGSAASAVLLSFLGGYPISARMAAKLYGNGDISREDARRMLRFCVNSGPAFCISALGGGMLGSAKAGAVIFASSALASVLVGAFSKPRVKLSLARSRCRERVQKPLGEAFCNSVASSSSGVFAICGYTILFSAFIAVIRRFLPVIYLRPFLPLLEITSGLSGLGRYPLWLYAAYISFGGFSVQFQLLRFSGGIGLKFSDILKDRLICAALSAVICLVALQIFPVSFLDISVSAPAVGLGRGSAASSFCLFFSAFVALGYLGQIFQKKNQII